MSSSSSPADGGGPLTSGDVDRALLAALARDGRASYTELAERVGLSVSAVHQRVRRLEQRGLITGYHAKLGQLGVAGAPVPGQCGQQRAVDVAGGERPAAVVSRGGRRVHAGPR